MKYSILNIILLIGFNLNSQSYFSKNIDIGTKNIQDFVISMSEFNDTIYFTSFDVINITDTSFQRCMQLCNMNLEGEILNCKLFDWIDLNIFYESMLINDSLILVFNGTCCYGDAKAKVILFSRKTLDTIGVYEYDLPFEDIGLIAETDIVETKKFYILSGWKVPTDIKTGDFPEFLMWIDKETMLIDTIIRLPIKAKASLFEELFVDKDDNLTAYYLSSRIEGDGNFNSRGFIKYNKDKEVIFTYRDSIEISTGIRNTLGSNALVLKSGNMVNTQKYIDPNPIFPDHGSDYDMVCTNDKGETVWRYNTPGHSPFGRKIISNMSETKDGDILGCGSLRWFKGMKEDDYSQPMPNNEDEYNAPYIIKIDGKTGEEIWEYALIEYDAYGHQGPGSLKEFFELSDGSLFGGGSYLPKDSVTGFNNVMDVENSWFIRLPADGCHKDLGCEFENYTTSSHEINLIDISENRLFKVFPNPTEGMLKIETDNDVTNVDIVVYSTTGQKVYQNSGDISDNKEINLSELTSGTYILQFTKKGKLIQNELIFKN